MASLGYNIEFPIYKEDDSLSGLVLHKSVVDSVVMSLGDKITGDVYVDGDIDLTMREYILYKDIKYTLVNPPTKVREGMVSDNSDLRGMTKYSFEFYHPMYQLSNMPFTDVAVSDDEKQYKSQDKTFSWVGYLADYVAKLNKNLQYSEWVVILNDNVSEDKLAKMSDVMSFDKNTIADALKTCYDTWEVPFVIDQLHANEYHDEDDNDYYAQGKRFVILFGLPSNEILDTNEQPFVFKFGQGVGLKNNSATSKNNKIITRIAGYGSEDNIPYGYPQIVWEGDQSWEYTINNRSGMQDVVIDGETIQAMSYPIYDGIVGGRYVKLIKHPFTRTHLMPSIYAIRVNKKVNPLADGYNPNIEIIDYYDADNDSFANQINPLAPSFEIHEFPDVKPELGEARIVDAYPYNEELAGAIPYSDYESEINTIINNESDNEEKSLLSAFRTWVSTKTSKTNPDHSAVDVVVGDVHYSVLSYEKYVSALYASNKHSLSYKVFIGDNDDSASWDDSMDMDGNYKQSYFKIQLPILSFDLYASAAITQKMDINMRSGACIGCTFPIQVDWEDYKKNFYDENGDFAPSGSQRDLTKYPNSQDTSIIVIVEKDLNTFGTLMPNIYQQPKANDQFVILGISLPTSYITTAEHKLDDDMITYMRENNVYYFDYPLKFDEYMLSQRTDILSQIRNNTVLRFELVEDVEIALYVKQITIKYGEKVLPQYDITLTDDVEIVLNKIGQVTEDVSRMRVQVADIYKYYNRNFDQRFLRKDKSDSTNYKLTLGELEVLRSATIGGDATVQGNTTLNGTTQVNGNMTFGGGYQEGVQGGKVSILNGGLVKMQVDYLDVTKKMSAKEVEIQKVSHIGGKLISTAARMICSRVVKAKIYTSELTNVDAFICFFENEDSDGRRIYNLFRKGDQAYCQTFNIEEGTSTDFANTYYWRLVIATSLDALVGGAQPTSEAWTGATSDLPQGTYTNCIVFIDDEPIGEDTDYTALNSTEPQAGDEIVQLGYRPQAGDTEEVILGRQGAIIQTAAASVIDVNNPSVPSLAMYKGINSFALPREPFVILSPAESKISSDVIQLESGETLDEVVDERYVIYQSEKKSKEDPDGVAAEMQAYIDSWTTPEDVREDHVGDFFLAADGFCWMFYREEDEENPDLTSYFWREVNDSYLTAYVNEIAKKTRTFVDGIGAQPDDDGVTYKVGDVWTNVIGIFTSIEQSGIVQYNNVTLVCITARKKGEDFSIDHWQELDGTRKFVTEKIATVENHIGDIDDSIGSINTSIGDINQGLWVGTDLVWYEAIEDPTGNPMAKGYYELDSYNKPQATSDTSVVSGKTYYERKVKQRAGLVTESDFTGLLAQNDVGTKAEISVSLQSANTYTNRKAEDVEVHAKEYADGKSATYRSENIPNAPYNEGDLWVKLDSTNGNLTYRCTTSRVASETTSMSDWELATDVDKRISVATIAADKVIIGTNDNNKGLNEVLVVQGNYVKAKNLAVEGFFNRGVMTIDVNTEQDVINNASISVQLKDNGESIGNGKSLDLLLCADTIIFTNSADLAYFFLPCYGHCLIKGSFRDIYIRPCTRYAQNTPKHMTLAQMRMLIGRKFAFINNTGLSITMKVGLYLEPNLTEGQEGTMVLANETGGESNTNRLLNIPAGWMRIFEFKSGILATGDTYSPYTEVLYWDVVDKANVGGGISLDEFNDE